jgi:sugar phosphate isomerase/epimerase
MTKERIKLGFISSALAGRSLFEIAAWGKAQGLEFLELGPHAPLGEVREYLSSDNQPLPVRALLYCRNILHPDPRRRAGFLANTEAHLDIARECGVPIVNISTGVDPEKTLRENVSACSKALSRLCERAGEGVTVAVENCPDTGNIAVNPELWALLLDKVNMPNFKLTYDPSHLIRLLIEPYEAISDFAGDIAHVHAKDAEVIHARLARVGFLDEGWWRYRVPGWGQVDWKQVLTRLYEARFSGGISLEHEDPLFGGSHDGTISSLERAEAGLRAGRAHLEPLLRHVHGET